jgi:ornithine decarboxylase
MHLSGFPHYMDTKALIAAEAPDYPALLFSEMELRRCAARFQQGFGGLVTYAVKANPVYHVLSVLADAGLQAFDVASPDEMAMVRQLAPDATLHYNNPVKSRREIALAFETYGITSYAIDNIAQLSQIESVVPPSRDVEITVRFKMGKTRRAYDFSTKFGVPETDAIDLATAVRRKGYSPSLCFHVGSQCEDATAYGRHIAAAGRIARSAGISLERLNVGGGFPAPYLSSGAPDIDVYFESIEKAVSKSFGASKPQMIVEPGRAMVTSSTSLLLRVKHQRDGRSIYLNDGVYGALMEVKFMSILPPTRVWRGVEPLIGEASDFKIWGPTCDSYDVLPRLFFLPRDIGEDDWVEFGLLGAYSQASTTAFNGFDKRLQYYVDNVQF